MLPDCHCTHDHRDARHDEQEPLAYAGLGLALPEVGTLRWATLAVEAKLSCDLYVDVLLRPTRIAPRQRYVFFHRMIID